jgi:hypothetical protein
VIGHIRRPSYISDLLDVSAPGHVPESLHPLEIEMCDLHRIYPTQSNSAKPDVPESETRGSGISRSSYDLGETARTKPEDWRIPLVRYLENHDHVTDRKVR